MTQGQSVRCSDSVKPVGALHNLQGKALGRFGEKLAQQFIVDKGWNIFDTNWSCSFGEIDIVAQNNYHELVFLEVKTGSTSGLRFPEESVHLHKQQRYAGLAQRYLQQYSADLSGLTVRFDVIAISIDMQDNVYLHHIPYAFCVDRDVVC